MISRRHFVYWLFDANDDCLYVGMTRYPEQRWKQHQQTRPEMCARVATRRMAGPFTELTARRFEREQQDDLQPRYDVRQASMRSRMRSLRPGAPTKWTGGLA